MKVEDIMSTDPVSVLAEASVREVVGVLLDRGVGSAMVLEDDRLSGIVTEADLLGSIHDHGGFEGQPVAEAMSSPLVTTTRTTSVSSALRTMSDHGIRHLPVVDGTHLVGIVSFSDVAAGLPERLEEARGTRRRGEDWQGGTEE